MVKVLFGMQTSWDPRNTLLDEGANAWNPHVIDHWVKVLLAKKWQRAGLCFSRTQLNIILVVGMSVFGLQVCGESLEGRTHENAIRTLRQTPSVIRLVVLRDEPAADDEIYDTITVDLVRKPGQGLGFSIVTRQNGVFVSDIVGFCALPDTVSGFS